MFLLKYKFIIQILIYSISSINIEISELLKIIIKDYINVRICQS